MPVNWLKLMSFATGAGVAAAAGLALDRAERERLPAQLLARRPDHHLRDGHPRRSGSQPGAVLGAILVTVLLQVLQNPGQARVLFYLVILLGVVAAFRFSIRLAIVAVSTAVFGIVVHAVTASFHHAWVDGVHGGFAGPDRRLGGRSAAPRPLGRPGLVPPAADRDAAARRSCTTGCASSRCRPTLYLAAFVWENQMIPNPGPARYIVLGLLPVVLMIVRPNGLLGERRVEIV